MPSKEVTSEEQIQVFTRELAEPVIAVIPQVAENIKASPHEYSIEAVRRLAADALDGAGVSHGHFDDSMVALTARLVAISHKD